MTPLPARQIRQIRTRNDPANHTPAKVALKFILDPEAQMSENQFALAMAVVAAATAVGLLIVAALR